MLQGFRRLLKCQNIFKNMASEQILITVDATTKYKGEKARI